MENLTRPRLVKSLLTIAFVIFQIGCTEVQFKDSSVEKTNTVARVPDAGEAPTPDTPVADYPPEVIIPPPPETPVPVTPPATPEPPVVIAPPTPAPLPPPPPATPPPVVTPTPPPVVVTPPPVCTPEVIHIPTKVLFIVDKSSSNQGFTFQNVPFGTTYYPGTDDNKVMRAGVISTFLQHYQNNTNFSWGFISFNDSSAKNLIAGLPKNQIFTNNANKMAAAIHEFQRKSDQGDTPYYAALSLAHKGLLADPDLKSSERINYILVFLSDGVPTDYAADSAGQKKLMSDVAQLVGLSPKISFNAVYYGQKNNLASTRLKQMSVIGKGLFLDTNLNPNGKDFKIEDVIEIPNSCN